MAATRQALVALRRSVASLPTTRPSAAIASSIPQRYIKGVPDPQEKGGAESTWIPKPLPKPDASFRPKHWTDFFDRYGNADAVPQAEVPKFDFTPGDLTLEELFELGYHIDYDPFHDEEELMDSREDQKVVEKERVMRTIDAKGRALTTGRRKSSTARVFLSKSKESGISSITVNGKLLSEYLPSGKAYDVLAPLEHCGRLGQYDIRATVKGGGITGQTGALRLGVARALEVFEPELRPALREAGFLTRDSRMVERKKFGLLKARKAPAWVKR